MIKVKVRPSFEYNANDGFTTRGSHHIRFCGPHAVWRLTTNASIQTILDETEILLNEPLYFVFGQDETFSQSLSQVCKDFEDRTINFWRNFVNNLTLPLDFQEDITRAAITLALLQSDE